MSNYIFKAMTEIQTTALDVINELKAEKAKLQAELEAVKAENKNLKLIVKEQGKGFHSLDIRDIEQQAKGLEDLCANWIGDKCTSVYMSISNKAAQLRTKAAKLKEKEG